MSDTIIDQVYERVAKESSDMIEHMPTLKAYASQCPRIIEFGVWDCTSTWGLLAGHPKWMRSYDTVRRPEVDEVEAVTRDSSTDFQFILGNTIGASVERLDLPPDQVGIEIEPVDLLFIDTYHTYSQLKQEFKLHAAKAGRYIILHDTTTFGDIDQQYDKSKPGLWLAIEEFLVEHSEWKLKERFTNCHGLTILVK